jgi:uncharacterized membrane protein
MDRAKIVLSLFFIAALMFLAVALIPLARGENLNAAFLVLAIVFFVLGVTATRKRPPAA